MDTPDAARISFYPCAGATPPATAAPVLPTIAPAPLSFEGVEVTQAIQDMAHSVPLVASKATAVRLYLGTHSANPVTVRGVLMVKANAPGTTWTQVVSIKPVLLNPSENGLLRLKRENIDKSLNFLLPPAATVAGTWTVALGQIEQLTPPPAVNLPLPPGANRTVVFHPTAPLRVRVIGVRYQDSTHGPTASHEPAAKDFVLIQSWLGRAYPVAEVLWSQVVVESPGRLAEGARLLPPVGRRRLAARPTWFR